MAAEVHQFTATIPANTAKTTPVTVSLALDYYEVESIDLEVPPGPAGLMGFYIARSGQQWIPYEADEWIVWDDRYDSWYLSDQPTGSGWQVVGYNLDVYDHDVVVRFHVNTPPTGSLVTAPPVMVTTSPSVYAGAVR